MKINKNALLGLISLCCLAFVSCGTPLLTNGNSAAPVALLYGVSRYVPAFGVDSYPNLSGVPPLDVAALSTQLSNFGWKTTYTDNNGHQFAPRTDSDANPIQLNADIVALAATVQPGQRVLFYYSGHGLSPNDVLNSSVGSIPKLAALADFYLALFGCFSTDGTLAVFDTSIDTATDIRLDSLISPKKLSTMLKPLADKGALIIIVLDCCFSGGFVSTGNYQTALPDNFVPSLSGSALLTDSSTQTPPYIAKAFSDYFTNATASSNSLSAPWLWVMSAAGNAEVSMQTYQHGLLCQAMLDGMTTYLFDRAAADANLDSRVTIQELFSYAKADIDYNWNKYQVASLNERDPWHLPHLAGNPLDIVLFNK